MQIDTLGDKSIFYEYDLTGSKDNNIVALENRM